jgi:Na+/melibiose symporter-like transporter
MPPHGVWRNPDFLKLWTGQTVSQMGSAISSSALAYTAIYFLRASPLQMGFLSGSGAAAILVFGLFAGACADRLRRRPILIAADLARAVVLASIPVAAALHRLTMEHLYVATAIGGVLTVLFEASYRAYVPSLLHREQVLEANSKLALSESIPEVVAPGFTGVLVTWITAPMTILFDAASFLISAISLALIRRPEARPKPSPTPHLAREITEGLQTSWRNPILRAVAMRTATASFFMGFFSSLYMIFAIKDLGLSAALLGTIISVGGATSLCGALVVERLVRRFGYGRTLIVSAAMPGIAVLVLPFARGSVPVCATFLGVSQLFDIAWPVYNISEMSLRQAIAPNQLLGRVNASMDLLFRGILPLGALSGGAMAQLIGTRTTMLAAAIGFLLSTLWLVFSPIRPLRTLPEAPLVMNA